MSSEEKQRQLDALMTWVTDMIASKTAVPRKHDVLHQAYAVMGFRGLTAADITRRLRLHPAYQTSFFQTRGPRRWKRYRPIITHSLGMLHGDLGYFSVKRDYETPITFRAGFLVLKDVLSRFTYAVILRKNKSADAMIDAFSKILAQHRAFFGPDAHPILSISFDKETSVMSNKVQAFLRENNIAFHPFQYSASKSKMAEGAIKQIRSHMAKMVRTHTSEHWWHLLKDVVRMLNSEEIAVNGKGLGWRPMDVTRHNVRRFSEELHKQDPSLYFGQFDVSPRHVNFRFPVGTAVRPKRIVTSSAAVGEKRSEESLSRDLFLVTEQLGYSNAKLEAGKAYRCLNLRTQQEEIFDEHDLAESVRPDP